MGTPSRSSQAFDPDVHAGLLSQTRRLSSEQLARRSAWFERLEHPSRTETLFELEVLLKGMVCYVNPRNHSGPAPRSAPPSFAPHLQILLQGARRARTLIETLSPGGKVPTRLRRYLPLPAPFRSPEASADPGPEAGLVELWASLGRAIELWSLVPGEQITTARSFVALVEPICRSIEHSTYFSPLVALEFTPEFDRLESPELIALLAGIPSGASRRLVALAVLGLARLLRYLNLLGPSPSTDADESSLRARIHLVLAVIRSDSRTLSDTLDQKAGDLLAAELYQSLFRVQSNQLYVSAASHNARALELMAYKRTLATVASSLRLEIRRAFHHDLPSPTAGESLPRLAGALQAAVSRLRPAVQGTLLFLGDSLGRSLDDATLDRTPILDRDTRDRLRRNVWMFSQIVRAFYTKAQYHTDADTWQGPYGFKYIREFLAYLRSIGYAVLCQSRYPGTAAFMTAIERLRDPDLVDRPRLARAVSESLSLHGYLQEYFATLSDTLGQDGIDFNRKAAASELRLYLGDSAR